MAVDVTAFHQVSTTKVEPTEIVRIASLLAASLDNLDMGVRANSLRCWRLYSYNWRSFRDEVDLLTSPRLESRYVSLCDFF